ncbi:hypothetical protein ABT369_32790 [Dactylosporangium sp. NPDC000244]|uniref:hypothetical protein n=1 Tax=Dactylosporangium sp. NPDC000244 TaxID=3154365 RepID=UPI00332DB1C3
MKSTAKGIGIGALVLALLPLAAADHGFGRPDAGHPRAQREAALPGEPMRYDAPPATSTGTPYAARAPRWPEGAATVRLGRDRARAGTLPVYVRAVGALAAGDLPVTVLDRAATGAAGVDGVVVRLGGEAGSTVHVDVDYRDFEGGFGGGAASSLGIVELSGCTPLTSACTAKPLPAANDVAHRTVGADVSAAATLAVVEEPKGPAGDYTATPLKASSTWEAGNSAGDFTWQYPLRMPPALNGPAPELGLSYSSGSIDGSMAASNNQPSWLGEGFEMSTGAIERKYVPCDSDMGNGANNTTKTGDLCWKTDNAVLHLNGQSTELLKGGDGRWHGRSEDGARIELNPAPRRRSTATRTASGGSSPRPTAPSTGSAATSCPGGRRARRPPTPCGPSPSSATTPTSRATPPPSRPPPATGPGAGTSTTSWTPAATRCRTGTRPRRTPTRRPAPAPPWPATCAAAGWTASTTAPAPTPPTAPPRRRSTSARPTGA